MRSQERDSDVSGRIQHPGGARSTVEPHEDRWHVESRSFANELAAVLERDRQSGRFDRLYVIAPPAFLGVLRQAWTPLLRERIAIEVAEDLTPLPENALQSRISEIVSGVRETGAGERSRDADATTG